MSSTRNISSLGLTPEQEALSENLNNAITYIVVLGVLAYMLGMGLAVDIPTFLYAFKKPKAAAIGLGSQIFINPLILFGIVRAFGDSIAAELQVAAILMSVAPGGNTSNFLVYLARGSIEVSVMMTICSTLLAFATMPFFVWFTTTVLWDAGESSIQIPYLYVALSAATASGPTLVGMYLQRFVPDKAKREKFTSYTVIFQLTTIATSSAMYLADPVFLAVLRELGFYPWVLALCLNLIGLTVGFTMARLFQMPRPYWRTIAYEVGAQNATIPLAVITVSFGSDAPFYVAFLVCYIITSIPANFGLLIYWRYFDVVSDEELEALKAYNLEKEDREAETTIKPATEITGSSAGENGSP